MKRTLLAAGAAALLIAGSVGVQEANAQVRIRSGVHHGGHYHGGGGYYRSGYWNGGGWGWGAGALLGATAALATAPLWAATGGYGYGYGYPYYSAGYYPAYDYGYAGYGYGYPAYYDGGYYGGYAAPVVYTTRVRPRRIVYAGPRRVIRANYVQRGRYVTYAPRAQRVIVRGGARPGIHRASMRY
ncbi:MAG: hypothetical protein JWN93_1384 [Hyphomicrobiales bacterium]|nr:hypothetical protein [Hyphomicrobiales bacterium]